MISPLSAISLRKVYSGVFGRGAIEALKGVSFALQPGEVFGLLGPNGAGKTTLVKVGLGLTEATSGECTLFGLPPGDPHSRTKVGYLPESHRFPRGLTGAGLVALSGRLQGMSERQLAERVDPLLATVGMTQWKNTAISKYSKGMAQRIGLAQALVHDPEVIILDEPTDGVDPVGRADIRDLIAGLRQRGKTVLLNSHILAEVELICDRVAIMDHGEILRIGAVQDLIAVSSEYELTGSFSGVPAELEAGLGTMMFHSAEKLTVRLTSDGALDAFTDWLRSKGGSIRSLTPRSRTLEEVFIDLLRRENRLGAETTREK